jgi:hypothetical protein
MRHEALAEERLPSPLAGEGEDGGNSRIVSNLPNTPSPTIPVKGEEKGPGVQSPPCPGAYALLGERGGARVDMERDGLLAWPLPGTPAGVCKFIEDLDDGP